MIDVGQPESVCKSLKNASLHRIANASHDLHQKYATTFKIMSEKHILGLK